MSNFFYERIDSAMAKSLIGEKYDDSKLYGLIVELDCVIVTAFNQDGSIAEEIILKEEIEDKGVDSDKLLPALQLHKFNKLTLVSILIGILILLSLLASYTLYMYLLNYI